MKTSALLLMSVLAGLATPAIADDFASGDKLNDPIAVLDSDSRTTSVPVNTRDRFGGNDVETKDEGAQSPIFSESGGE